MVRPTFAVAALLLFGCHKTNNVTTPCTTASECPPSLPMCTPDSHICVGCLADFQTCGPNKTCDDKTHTCVPAVPGAPCVRDADCPRPGVDPNRSFTCEVDSGACVNCVSNKDCPTGVCTPTFVCDTDGGSALRYDLGRAD